MYFPITDSQGDFTVDVLPLDMPIYDGETIRVNVHTTGTFWSPMAHLIGKAPVDLTFRPFVRVLEPDYQFTSTGPGTYSLTVSGRLHADFLGFAAGEDIQVYVDHWDGAISVQNTYDLTTLGDGSYTLTIPDMTFRDFDSVYIQIYDRGEPSNWDFTYYGDMSGTVPGPLNTWF